MRNIISNAFITGQFELGQIDISNIKIDAKSRDQIPQTLLGLQHIYNNKQELSEITAILKDEVVNKRNIDSKNGRNGIYLWQIYVMSVMKSINDWDYDHLEGMVNSHREIRQMLGLGILDEFFRFKRRTLENNLSLVSQEAWDEINEIVVKLGHGFLGVENEKLKVRVDSKVVKTNVHHPTDTNLLMDAVKKIFCVVFFLTVYLNKDISQSKNELKKIRKLFNKIRKMRRSTSKNEKQRQKRNEDIKNAHRAFLVQISELIEAVKGNFDEIPDEILDDVAVANQIFELSSNIDYAAHQISLTERRVINGETIEHHEKIHSIFEYYTQWIAKGKAKTPVELGLRVAVMDDQYGFILHSEVMYKSIEEQLNEVGKEEITAKPITDEKITVSFAADAFEKFGNISDISFDKGFYFPGGKEQLQKFIKNVVLPKKGKLSLKDKQFESSEVFIDGRKRHSGIESSIHALENHGFGACRDRGLAAFRRHVGRTIVSRNIQVLGSHIQKDILAREKLAKAS